MNGRVDYLITEEEINLTRGPSGMCRTNHRLRVEFLRLYAERTPLLRSQVLLAPDKTAPNQEVSSSVCEQTDDLS